MSSHGRPPSPFEAIGFAVCAMAAIGAAVIGLVAFFAWLHGTPTLAGNLKVAIGAGIITAVAGAIARIFVR